MGAGANSGAGLVNTVFAVSSFGAAVVAAVVTMAVEVIGAGRNSGLTLATIGSAITSFGDSPMAAVAGATVALLGAGVSSEADEPTRTTVSSPAGKAETGTELVTSVATTALPSAGAWLFRKKAVSEAGGAGGFAGAGVSADGAFAKKRVVSSDPRTPPTA
jgi:hypothetical protein